MTTVVSAGAVVAAVIDALDDADLLVGDGDAPPSAGWAGEPGQSVFVGYCVVHSLPAFSIDGNAEDPEADVTHMVQVSSYGATRAQAQQVAHLARTALLASSAVSVSGRRVLRVFTDEIGQVIRLTETRPNVWHAPDRFRIPTVEV